MNLLQPAWLALLALGPLIVLLHVRRPRRVPISSVLIWRRVVRDGEPEGGRQGGSLDWPLALQLAALVAVSLALARPAFGFDAGVDHRVYLLDSSYGMLAADGSDQPLDRALAWLDGELRNVPSGVAVTVVAAGRQPQALAVRASGGEVQITAEEVVTWATAAHWRAAARLAAGAAAEGERTSLTLLTTPNGAPSVPASSLPAELNDGPPRVVTFGGNAPNLGFVEAALVRSGDMPTGYTLVGALAATHDVEEVEVLVERGSAAAGGFEPWERLTLNLSAGEPAAFSLELPDSAHEAVRLSLVAEDAQAMDDRVTLPLAQAGPARVLVVGDPAPALARALSSLPGVEAYVTPELTTSAEEFDLVIFNEVDTAAVPRTSTLWLGAAPGGRADVPLLDQPTVTSWARHHQLAEADWSGLEVHQALALPPLPGATAIVSSGGVPLIQVRAVDHGYQAIVAFALRDSNWADSAGFPVFLSQLLELVEPVAHRDGVTACVAGASCRLGARFARPGVELTAPDGGRWPPRAAFLPEADEFAGGRWLLGGEELSFVPRLPGDHASEGSGEPYLVPVVVDPGAFVLGRSLTEGSEAIETGRGAIDGSPSGTGSGAAAQRPGLRGPGPTAVLAALAAALMTVNALLLWRRRVRWLGRRRVLANVATALFVATLVATLLELPFPRQRPAGEPVTLVDARLAAPGDVPSASTTVAVSGVIGAEPRAEPDEPVPAATALDARTGLELAAALAAGNGSDAVVIEGFAGRGPSPADVLQVGASARAKGVVVDLHSPSIRADAVANPVELGELYVPDQVRAGSAVELLVSATAVEAVAGVLEVKLESTGAIGDGPGVDVMNLFQADVELQQGSNALRLPVTFGEPMSGRLTVVLSTTAGELLATSRTALTVVAPPHALVVASAPLAADTMASALELQGFEVDVEPVINVPWSLEGWTGRDLLVLLDVPAHSLHSTQLEALEQWVERRGGGLVIFGGETSFGPGGYLRTPLDTLSPLSSQVPQEAPEVTMLFLVDRSGSMQQVVGETTRMGIAKEATVSAMELLGPGSQVGVVVYDAVAQVLVPLTPIEELERVRAEVETVRANGGTALHPALLAAGELLSEVDSAAVHVVVLTDGMSQPGEFRSAISEIKAQGATISFVGIGSGADKIQLGDLAALAGGALHVTDDVRALPSILAQEALMASHDLVRQGEVAIEVEEAARSMLPGLPGSATVNGYVLTEAKPGAEVLVTTVGDEPAPLLATWRYGLGRVAALASQGVGPWTESWLRGADFTGTWGQLARWTAASEVPSLDISLAVDGGTISVMAHSYEDSGAPATGRSYLAQLRQGDALLGEVPLVEAGAGRYEATLEAPAAGAYRASVRWADGEGLVERPVLVGELGPWRDATAPLFALPVLTGGELLTGARADALESSAAWSWRPATEPWLLLMLAAFLGYLLVVYGVPRPADIGWALAAAASKFDRTSGRSSIADA